MWLLALTMMTTSCARAACGSQSSGRNSVSRVSRAPCMRSEREIECHPEDCQGRMPGRRYVVVEDQAALVQPDAVDLCLDVHVRREVIAYAKRKVALRRLQRRLVLLR